MSCWKFNQNSVEQIFDDRTSVASANSLFAVEFFTNIKLIQEQVDPFLSYTTEIR